MKALVVDDDRLISDLVAFTLRREGFQILQAYEGETALQIWEAEQPDVIILDVNLPSASKGLDGFRVCERIRAVDDVPIILLTVRADENDVVHGLKLGADDYVAKPFSPRQLAARVEAVMRRSAQSPQLSMRVVRGIQVDSNRRSVQIEESSPISLTPLEYRLLNYLLVNAGQVVPFETLITQIWGADGGERDMLRQLVHRLRAKLETDPQKPSLIETIPGIGYGILSRVE